MGIDNFRVEVDSTKIEAEAQTEAQVLGEQYNASIVIWGADTGVRVTVNYLNLKDPDFEASQVRISETERTQIANPPAYNQFVTTDLPGQLTFLALFAVGESYSRQAKYIESVAVIEKAVASLHSDKNLLEGVDDAYFRLGWLHQVPIGDLEKTIANYTQAIDLNPVYAKAYNNRGVAYLDLGDLEQAIADYTQAIALNPDDADAYNNRGVAYHGLGDLEQAIADYIQAIVLNPDDTLAYYNRGNAYRDRGDLEQAIADFTQAIVLNPDYAKAYNNRGNAYYDLGNLEQAIADYTQAIALNLEEVVAVRRQLQLHSADN